MSKIYQGQPLKLLIDTRVDLNTLGATQTDLEVTKPDGTVETWTGSINATNARLIEYDCVGDASPYTSADLDQVGRYSLMSIVDDSGGNGPWPGDTYHFEVHQRHT